MSKHIDDSFLEGLSRKIIGRDTRLLTREQLCQLLKLPPQQRPEAMKQMLDMKRSPKTKRSDDTI